MFLFGEIALAVGKGMISVGRRVFGHFFVVVNRTG